MWHLRIHSQNSMQHLHLTHVHVYPMALLLHPAFIPHTNHYKIQTGSFFNTVGTMVVDTSSCWIHSPVASWNTWKKNNRGKSRWTPLPNTTPNIPPTHTLRRRSRGTPSFQYQLPWVGIRWCFGLRKTAIQKWLPKKNLPKIVSKIGMLNYV